MFDESHLSSQWVCLNPCFKGYLSLFIVQKIGVLAVTSPTLWALDPLLILCYVISYDKSSILFYDGNIENLCWVMMYLIFIFLFF